jgi:hypothetical protein
MKARISQMLTTEPRPAVNKWFVALTGVRAINYTVRVCECVCGTLTALEVVGKPAGERLVAGQGSITLPARRRGHGPRHYISDAVLKYAFWGESHGGGHKMCMT